MYVHAVESMRIHPSNFSCVVAARSSSTVQIADYRRGHKESCEQIKDWNCLGEDQGRVAASLLQYHGPDCTKLDETGKLFKSCSRCKHAVCQRKHWQSHKDEFAELVEQAKVISRIGVS